MNDFDEVLIYDEFKDVEKEKEQQILSDEVKIEEEEQAVYVFDQEEYEEQIVYNRKGGVQERNNEDLQILSSTEYQQKCENFKQKILFNNLINLNKDILKPPKNFFKQAKQKRESQDYLKRKNDKQNLNEFQPRVKNVKVDFIEDEEFSVGIRNRIGEEAFDESILQNKKQKQRKSSFKGAQLMKKNSMQIEEDKSRNIIKVTNFRQFLFTQLKPTYQIFIILKRTENGIFNTTYKCYFKQNKNFILSCQKQPFSKYIFSTSQVHIAQDHISYLGKMESNFSGTEFTLYDNGEDSSATKMMENYKKQIAFINYTQEKGQPRKLQAFITTCNNSSTDFTIIDNNNNIIQSLWKKGDNKNISRLTSKQPNFDPSDGNYKLDFKGMAGIPSVKNFIISSNQYYESLIFGRQDKDTYQLCLKCPFSILQAIGICLSSIHYKFL